MTDPQDEIVGKTVLGRYRIVRRLARGGMGVVYLARTEGAAGFAKPAVVKRILPDLTGDKAMTEMFKREARILAKLNHPGIVSVLDFGEDKDGAYIMVLEYVHGFHLGRWYRYVHTTQGGFPASTAVHIMIKVLESLHYAHNLHQPDGKSLHIVHRDVSPSNILLDHEGRVKLVDFGIARMIGETAVYKTEELTVKGKFPYLAPELFTGQPASIQSDVYACGVVLHELLIGRNEFRGKDVAETVHRVFSHVPSMVHRLRDDVSKELDAILRKSLMKTAADRYASAAEFAKALRGVRGGSEEEVAQALAEQVRHDFFGDMAERLGIEPLQLLDSAWRRDSEEFRALLPPPPESISPPSVATHSGRPTEQAKLNVTPTLTRGGDLSTLRRRSSLWKWLLSGTALLTLLGGGVWLLRNPALWAKNNSRVIVLEHERLNEGEEAVQPTLPQEDEAAAAVENVEKERKPRTERPAKGGGKRPRRDPPKENKGAAQASTPQAQLTQAFKRQEDKIRSCFKQHYDSTAGLNTQGVISIRFKVETSGRVAEASVSPPGVATSPLGGCLLQVARGTAFGPQPAEISFRIPISSRIGSN